MKKLFITLSFYVSISLPGSPVWGQQGFAKGDMVPDLPVAQWLNASPSFTSLSSLGNKLVILDFFGTWCAPCLKALPHLTEIQNEYSNYVRVVLVSNEKETQLRKFMNARKGFSFPIIVDADNQWNAAFQPPSFPYTVIIRNGKLLAITEAALITTAAVARWIKEPMSTAPVAAANYQTKTLSVNTSAPQQSSNAMVRLSQEYIYAAKTGASLVEISNVLMSLPYDKLQKTLSNDAAKKAFWINLYNGYTQATLSTSPEKYKNRNAFFKEKAINVAGTIFSLDDIEHGLLRRSKIKWSLGLLNKIFPSKKEKDLRVSKLDYRLHFALNCGARSCPPIAFYNDETLDRQLDLATKAFLSSEAEYDSINNIIRLPKLMSWFRADFGGRKGMRQLLQKHAVIGADAKPAIKFKDYDWTLTLNNYTKQNP